MNEITFHECADIFPLLEDEKLKELAEDIEKNGQLEPIVLFNGEILDGRNRYLACKLKNIEPLFRVFNLNVNPIDFVISKNLVRRQLTPAQKAESALKAIELKEKLRERQIDSMSFDNELEKEAMKEAIKHEDTKEIAKKYETNSKTIERVKEIKEVSKVNPKIKEAFEDAKNNKKSVKEVHREALGKEPKKRKSVSYKELSEDLKVKLAFYKTVECACKALKVWDKVIEHLLEPNKLETYNPTYTLKEYRKAGLKI